MWMVANYVMSLSRVRRDQLQERYGSARDALAGLPHDNCANYLAHIQAEACARLGRTDMFLETVASHARYFDRDLEEGEFFRGKDRHLLTGVSRLAGELARHRGWRARVALWKFRLRGSVAPGVRQGGPAVAERETQNESDALLLYRLYRPLRSYEVLYGFRYFSERHPMGTGSPGRAVFAGISLTADRAGRPGAGGGPETSLLPPGARDAAPFSLAVQDRDLVARVLQWTSEKGSYGATGEIVNRGTKAFHFVMVRVEFCDRAGRVVGVLTTEGRREEIVLPGRAISFAVKGSGKLDFATARASVAYATELK